MPHKITDLKPGQKVYLPDMDSTYEVIDTGKDHFNETGVLLRADSDNKKHWIRGVDYMRRGLRPVTS